MPSKPARELPILTFDIALHWERWLSKNHAKSDGIWLRIAKKSCGKPSLTYSDALDTALCFGWIDGQKQAHSDTHWLQRLTPRRKKSRWSKINIQHAKRLIAAGRMKAAGLREIEAAKRDGRWAAAYDSQKNATVPDDFVKLLSANKKAFVFFATLNKANLYSIAYRLQTAKKPETREKRMRMIIEMLARGEKFR